MLKPNHIILGVHISGREVNAAEVQRVLTKYGSHIKTRLGLHEVEQQDSPNGLLILELWGDESRCFDLQNELVDIAGIEVQRMTFEHD